VGTEGARDMMGYVGRDGLDFHFRNCLFWMKDGG